MRNLAKRVLAATSFVALTVSAIAMPPVPRKSPEFTVTDPAGKQILLFAKAFSSPRKATRGTSSVLDKDARHNLTMEVPIPFVFIEVLRFLHNR